GLEYVSICFVGALDSRLNVQQVRLAGCHRAPPRSWTLLIALAAFLLSALGSRHGVGIRWEAWGEAAFERARREGKPALLVLTAQWCHACHRMDEDTWDDPGVAALGERLAAPVT